MRQNIWAARPRVMSYTVGQLGELPLGQNTIGELGVAMPKTTTRP